MSAETRKIQENLKTSDRRVEIIIAEDDTDTQPVQVGVNGRMYVIKRGIKVSVPPSVVEVLKHAIKTVYPSGNLQKPRDVLQYPFQIV